MAPSPRKREHDTLVTRLTQILFKLNQGQALDPRALADEFAVNLRTIQRDLNERFAYLPLLRKGTRYAMDPAYLGKLTSRDMERFARLAGVGGLFPTLSDSFLRDIFDHRIDQAVLVKGQHYEDLRGKEAYFKALQQAIVERHTIDLDYSKADGSGRHYPSAQPYKLVNEKGIWYLVAYFESQLKTFSFTRISRLHVKDEVFVPNPAIEHEIESSDSIWLGQERIQVTLRVEAVVASYFKRRKLIANQTIETEHADGSLDIRVEVIKAEQLLPIVRYWIPHIRITSPVEWQGVLEQGLVQYVS